MINQNEKNLNWKHHPSSIPSPQCAVAQTWCNCWVFYLFRLIINVVTNVSQPAQWLYDNTTVAKARPVLVALWQPVHSWQFLRKEKQFFHSSLIDNILLCSVPTLFYVNYTERLWVVEVMDWTVSQHIITLIRQYIASIELELERISTKYLKREMSHGYLLL